MSTAVLLAIVVGAVLIVAVTVLAAVLRRRRGHQRAALRQRFGPEYDRVMEEQGSRRQAERELHERERRHERLDLRPLDEGTRQRYLNGWVRTQSRFVDEPNAAVSDADKLVTLLMDERGYPTGGEFDDRLAHLSVEHANVLDDYRSAHQVALLNTERRATTEQLRQAMLHYRRLFDALLGTGTEQHPTTAKSRGRHAAT